MAEEKNMDTAGSEPVQESLPLAESPAGEFPEVSSEQAAGLPVATAGAAAPSADAELASEAGAASATEPEAAQPLAIEAQDRQIEAPEAAGESEAEAPLETIAESAEAADASAAIAGEEAKQPQELSGGINRSTIIAIAAILLAVIGIIYFAARQAKAPTLTDDGQKVTVLDEPAAGTVSIIEEATADLGTDEDWPSTEVFAFFGNSQKASDANNCAQVFALKRSTDKKYDSNLMNTVGGLLQPLSEQEKQAGYFSTIPAGTALKYLKLKDTGAIEANFSGAIKNAAGSCAVAAIRAQITQTLMQFSSVKSVTICIDGNCNDGEILQP